MRYEQYKDLRDEEIIQLIVSEEQKELYALLYNRYQVKVQDKCYSLLRDRDLAEEAKQNILEKTYEKLDSFKGKSTFSSWLYSITYNYCIDYLRNKKKMSYPEWNRQQEIPEIIEQTDEEEDVIDSDKLNAIMDRIHPEEKALLMMKYHDDISISGIAKALRLTESATKMRIKRARARVLYLYNETYKNKD
jgi:RNA polymerase sigma-70 factor (ECF subfamily)